MGWPSRSGYQAAIGVGIVKAAGGSHVAAPRGGDFGTDGRIATAVLARQHAGGGQNLRPVQMAAMACGCR